MINNKYNMKDGQTFIITYTKKDGEKVTRNGKFILGKCGEWISKAGEKLFTYFDVDQSNRMGGDQYRMAKNNWEIK
jgi:flagellar basal body rod protein FlgG